MRTIIYVILFVMCATILNAQQPTVSATGITFKYCIATEGTFEASVEVGELPYHKDGFTFPAFGTYTRTITNARGCDSIVTYTISKAPSGFTINSSGAKVAFSPGNLQYRATSNGTAGDLTHVVRGGSTKNGEFRFAEHQWDFVGDDSYGTVYIGNMKCSNSQTSSTYKGWIDLFAFGSSGYQINPYSTSSSTYAEVSFGPTASENDRKYDWGYYNTIGNDAPGTWRSLTKEEWEYLFSSRANYSTRRYAAIVHGVEGLILLPDAWINPGVSLSQTIRYYSNNTLTDAQWTSMEENGAIFIPKGGYRRGTSVNEVGSNLQGYIWTSTYNSSGTAWRLYMNTSNSDITISSHNAVTGRCVRLVKDL